MGEWRETFRGVVFPWNCDHIGHMNVRWYAHHFDDAGFHLWSVAGIPQSQMHANGIGLVVAQIKIDYLHEMKAGELFVIRSAFVHVGNRSIKHLARMFNADTGVLCATQETVEVFFDPKTRKSAPMPEHIREKLLPLVVAVDAR
jgi:acyl-CoA thioester hydrolase